MLNASSAAMPARPVSPGPSGCKDRFLSVADVSRVVGLSKTTIYKYVGAGAFPDSVPVGPKRIAWLESEVMQWMAACVEARNRKGRRHA